MLDYMDSTLPILVDLERGWYDAVRMIGLAPLGELVRRSGR